MDEDSARPTWAVGLKRSGLYYEGFVDNLEDTLEAHRRCTLTPGLQRRPQHSLLTPTENDGYLWQPHLIKDISKIERIQWWATKYILSDTSSNYKQRLLTLELLLISHWYELQDILYLVKCLKDPPSPVNFQLSDYISFVNTSTRYGKLQYNFGRSTTTTTSTV